MEEEAISLTPFDMMSKEERIKTLESTFNEIYTRLDNARRLGVDLSGKGKPSTPFRNEDVAPQKPVDLLFEYLKLIEGKVREIEFVPKAGQKFHEFKNGPFTIRVPLKGDEQSRESLGCDVDIEAQEKNRIVHVQRFDENKGDFFKLDINFLPQGEYEGLEYKGSNAINHLNMEEYIVSSYYVNKAYAQVFGAKGASLS